MKLLKILSFICLSVLFMQCESDDDPAYNEEQFVGHWKMIKLESNIPVHYNHSKNKVTDLFSTYEEARKNDIYHYLFNGDYFVSHYGDEDEDIKIDSWLLVGDKIVLSFIDLDEPSESYTTVMLICNVTDDQFDVKSKQTIDGTNVILSASFKKLKEEV